MSTYTANLQMRENKNDLKQYYCKWAIQIQPTPSQTNKKRTTRSDQFILPNIPKR